MTESTRRSPAETMARLSLEEKASLTSGRDFWSTEAVPRENVPSIMLTDGPHGVRKQTGGGDHLGLNASVPATCFPPAVALGCSFDPDLLERVGRALGEEAQALQVGVLLGPGINIKRSPLCGRNFEYLSEDPLLSGILGTALVRGIQSQGVGASLKHFAVNNQETDRMRVSADVDPRPLHEIYLRGFRRVVREAQPWTVMCSYNRINGVFASRNRWLLTELLREQWGFEGLVVSDWGAVDDRVAALAAGLDLEMPSTGGRTDAQIVAAVRAGELDESLLDTAAIRVLELVDRAVTGADPEASFDADAHHVLAREVAGQCIVLLKNDDDLLPLAPDTRLAVIGELARDPRYQGAGSSRINPTRLDDALDEIRALAANDVAFAAGYAADGSDSAGLVDEAVALARTADVAVVFLGVPAELESEGFDRDDLELPANQTALLDAVVAANPSTVVVLSNGGVVRLSGFADRVPAIVEGWLLGQAGGGAVADVLFGVVNPSGRLAETVPVRLEDTPAFGNFPGELGHVRYGEGLHVGYRWYDARDLDVAFPFGHGLSYTTFGYSDATVDDASGDADLTVRVTVANTGSRAGAEVVQVYVGLPSSSVTRPPRELKGFAKVHLDPGESRRVEIPVRRDDLAYWDTRVDSWIVEGGTYTVEIGASSRDIRQRCTVDVPGDPVRLPLSMDSSIGELLENPAAADILAQAFGALGDAGIDESVLKMASSMPIGRIVGFVPGVSREQIQQLLDAANRA
ncbi:glycoside hydrolase family 3 C-terminal domain-containing protein [Rhodococcus sp. Z13]|uniref:Glycoside hydrolase family 3 C-terminal domain-containing protein n=1 Tax=Rhodococcus sacchari TaxID=2962047 RepID=A0ACD4DJD1_9NOCA|nr:glycoside hydrolase family 3 C-terminal domain-containing protein [Rhodococcus sp. Z13]UYP20174.1 glycoside hydrolase family 3 C-terminal domain-containing protein [Rhodococcus sp. Z13]